MSLASRADRYALYEQSVQDPPSEVRMLRRAYREAYGREPLRLREDFCGTAAVAAEWVRSHRQREAMGLDLDPAPLAWGMEHHVSALTLDQRARLRLLRRDVRTVTRPPADVVAAQNFSFFTFKTSRELHGYCRAAYRSLGARGVLLMDMMGGSDCLVDNREERVRHRGFTYIWDQARYEPIHNNGLFHIHFQFKDGSRLRKAFTYDWRLWSIPEVREALAAAGFRKSVVYWALSDSRTGDANGAHARREKAPGDPAWLAYVVGIK